MVIFSQKLKSKSRKGFTLIELLVVISVIGLLASVVLISLNDARKKARDARRIADMQQLQKALDIYYDQNGGKYPGDTSSYGEAENADPYSCGGWDTSEVDFDGDGKSFITPLITSGIIAQAPHDPIGTKVVCSLPYGYRYYRYPAGACSDLCNGGAFYVLGINNLESGTGAKFNSPGWKCHEPGWTGGPPGDPTFRDWALEFGAANGWVTGKCE